MGLFDFLKTDKEKKNDDSLETMSDQESAMTSSEGTYHHFRVAYNSVKNEWITTKSAEGKYSPVNLHTGIYMNRDQLKAFFEGMKSFKGGDINESNSEEKQDEWVNFLKKTKLFDGWDLEPNDPPIYPHDIFWWKYPEFVPLEFDINSQEEIDKYIDEFIELAKKGEGWGPMCDGEGNYTDDDSVWQLAGEKYADTPSLSAELEVLIYDDPNDRNWADLIGETEDYSGDNDKEFTTDMQFSRQNIETILKAGHDTYKELSDNIPSEFRTNNAIPSMNLDLNEEKAFVHWIDKLRTMPEFSEFWFPEKHQVIGKYLSYKDKSDVSALEVLVNYNGKEVECVWTFLWRTALSSPYSQLYHRWDEAGPDEIDKAIDEFLGDFDDTTDPAAYWDRCLDRSLNIITWPSHAPVKKGTIRI